jgi:hypothetical protein
VSDPLVLRVPQRLCSACGSRRWKLGDVYVTAYGDLPKDVSDREWGSQVRWDCGRDDCDEWCIVTESGNRGDL